MAAIEAQTQFRIGELARRAGATPRAVRYYEELGLLPGHGRRHGSHRLYDADDESRSPSCSGSATCSASRSPTCGRGPPPRRPGPRFASGGRPTRAMPTEPRSPPRRGSTLDTQLALVRARRAALEQLEDELDSKRRRVRDVLHELDERVDRAVSGAGRSVQVDRALEHDASAC